ncbi:hypothetical protein [Streptomyces poonensis]|uniref:Transferase n=1 Tax=Streptomyces poonensis TaxID=68255 RepID=A0A918PGJ1_9ACTN|nr:hypothetical protein [Streptomyces poonensis]GGZ06584.1 hypothetical protein GCM10010365_26910 [Streptomyces poonensis]GLJ88681.1 hypothetical protein GCM10017589_12810 [Streptomyces poonensis]
MSAPAPRADCVADPEGGLTFAVTAPGGPGPAHLVLRLRGGEQETRLPLTPAGTGRLRCALPGDAELPEGRWDVYVQTADGAPRRLLPGLNDLRRLVDRVPGGAGGRVAVRIPYATKYGNLSVRSWLRAPHAEAGDLHVGGDGLGVSGRVYGTSLTEDAYVEAVDREGAASVARAGLSADGDAFHCTVAYGAPAPGVLDLWLRPVGEAGPRVRIARLLDDVADKKLVFVYPGVALKTDHGPVVAVPYYTTDNDLSVAVTKAD